MLSNGTSIIEKIGRLSARGRLLGLLLEILEVLLEGRSLMLSLVCSISSIIYSGYFVVYLVRSQGLLWKGL